jgi:GDPmannose 4,6-dehydratase
MPTIALLTGCTGQAGSYLAELLLEKGYEVHGVIRRSSTFNTDRIDHIFEHPRLHLHYGDLTDQSSISKVVYDLRPDEIYNLGAQSHVRVSFDIPENTGDVTGLGALRVFEAARIVGAKAKIYQASSSEMFGASPPPQNEDTPFKPISPYSVAKLYAYYMAKNYRDSYGMFISNGILFNYESERRGETFVTRKITRAATRIKLGLQKELRLGNLKARRDWGHAEDYVYAMWLMLQHNCPDDFVVATGENHTVEEFLEKVFTKLDLDWKEFVVIDPKYFRPCEVESLLGDSTKARKELGWEPKVSFDQLVDRMVVNDWLLARKEKASNGITD